MPLHYFTDTDTRFPSPRFPTEIVDRIIEIFIAQLPINEQVTGFSPVAPFTLVSADFRQIALRQYFYSVTLMNQAHWNGVYRFLEAQVSRRKENRKFEEGFSWVRSLSAHSKILSFKPTRIRSLPNLRTLSIDLTLEGLNTQHPFLKSILGTLGQSDTWPNMISLTLLSLPRVDTLLLRLIAKKCPSLSNLHLSCTERIEFGCCYGCFEESLSCTIHSPIPDEYSDIVGLAHAFANILKTLTHLKHLHLGIFLSNERLLYSAIGHAENPATMIDWSRCTLFFERALETVRSRELAASIIIGQKIGTLETICWSSLFAGMNGRGSVEQHVNSDDTVEDDVGALQDERLREEDSSDTEDDNDDLQKVTSEDDMKTTIRILRRNGRITARRAP